jgi:hypothetical protein
MAVTGAGSAKNTFGNTQDPMIRVLAPAKPTVPILSTGDTMPGNYSFGSIPDGIALRTRGQGRLDVIVNHETSTVPFPFNPPFGATPPALPTEANQNDFENSQVSQLAINQNSGKLLSARYLIDSDDNYHRFCSSFLATQREGFDRDIYFANEEAQDWVFRTGTSWPGPTFIPPGTPNAEQTGVTAALDVQNGKFETIYGMGRLNHENTVAIPVNEGIAILTTDDTFFTTPQPAPYKPAWSQLYMYLADDVDDLLADGGDLYAFVSETAGYDDYFDFDPATAVASQPVLDGHFIKVPKHIATGKHPVTGAELLSTSVGAGYTGMLPPPVATGPPPDGPQWVLDQWGNANINAQDGELPVAGEDVFRFVRLEDVAYDKRPGMSNHVYIADSGRATAGAAPTKGVSTNGRVWKFVLDPANPTDNVKMSLLVEGDDNPVAVTNPTTSFGEIHNPDNIETTVNGSLFVQEDPSSNNQYPFPRDATDTPARIWRVDLTASNPDAARLTAAEVDQALDETAGYDVDAAPRANLGNWESSGIVDASSVFGPGAYLVTIQAHSLWIAKADGPDAITTPAANTGKDFTFKREGGQIALIYLNPTW